MHRTLFTPMLTIHYHTVCRVRMLCVKIINLIEAPNRPKLFLALHGSEVIILAIESTIVLLVSACEALSDSAGSMGQFNIQFRLENIFKLS